MTANIYLCFLVCLHHWQLQQLWGSWIFKGLKVRLSSNPFCSACALMLQNRPRIQALLFFQRGCRHYPCFGRRVNRSLIWVFELRDIFRQVLCFLRAHLSWCKVSSCVLSSNFGSHTDCALEVRTDLHNSLRWTLSFQNFCDVPRALGDFDGVIWSHSSPLP